MDLLAGLEEEHGASLTFFRQSPEFDLVLNMLGLAKEAGGDVAIDAMVKRLQSRLAEDLDPEELSTAMGDLTFRIQDAAGGS